MTLTTIKKIIDTIYFSKLDEDEQVDIKLYAPYFIVNDSIGKKYIFNCIVAKKIDLIKKLIVLFVIIWYFYFILFYPIFYSQNFLIFPESIKFLSFGLTDFLYNIAWYWKILFHVIIFLVLGIFNLIIEELLDIDFSSYKKYRNRLREYVLVLFKKGLITDEALGSFGKGKNIGSSLVKKQSFDGNSNEIFVVHGHDDSSKFEVARFIDKIGLKAIILHEQINSGKTIIEKIEQYTDVIFSLVLLTPDDILSDSYNSPIHRARQNVIFELGYLMAKLGRSRICALVKDNVEIPSDISGVVYIPYDKEGAWKIKVAKEMKAVGIDIDFNSLY